MPAVEIDPVSLGLKLEAHTLMLNAKYVCRNVHTSITKRTHIDTHTHTYTHTHTNTQNTQAKGLNIHANTLIYIHIHDTC